MYKGIEKGMKKPKILLPMSLIFAEEQYNQGLWDFLFHRDVGGVCSGVQEVENSDFEKTRDGGV